jgi:hypothetical protein
MSTEKELIAMVNDQAASTDYRILAALRFQAIQLKKIYGRLDLLAGIFFLVLLLQACSAIGLL